jgi:C-terminal processing protease CtpA/Prc
LQGALEPKSTAPPNSYTATISAHGPLGIEVEWAHPPKMFAVAPGSLAQRAGMRAGDLLLRVDDVDVVDWPADRIATLFGKRPLRMTLQHTTAALPDVNLHFEGEEDEDERELAV